MSDKLTGRQVKNADEDVFTAIAHPVRRQILDMLAEQAMNVNDLAAPFEASRSAISQHLKILLDTALVTREKHGREQVYKLRPENLNAVASWLNKYEQFWPQKLDALASFLDTMEAAENAVEQAAALHEEGINEDET
jgi:DNA-binding transcriptional ArsR family regulator